MDPRTLLRLRAAVTAFSPDVILAVNYDATLWARIVGIHLRIPVVTAEHSSTRPSFRPEIVLSNALLASRTAAVVAVAQSQAPYVAAEHNPADRIVVIPNGVDCSVFRPDPDARTRMRDSWAIPSDAPLIGISAAHRVEKRHDRFVRLIEGLTDQGAWGVMVGGGALLERTRDLVRTSPARDRIVVAGAVGDMPAAYAALDLCVLTSDSVEAFPLAFLEAQACAVPVVGFDVGGVAETLVDGKTGVVIRADDEAGMAATVGGLLRDRDRLAGMAAGAREHALNCLDLDSMVREYESLLVRVAEADRVS
jgi:glycosyltransferase involved in cell wall biosynthesis